MKPVVRFVEGAYTDTDSAGFAYAGPLAHTLLRVDGPFENAGGVRLVSCLGGPLPGQNGPGRTFI